ncbi:GNAT family N-acetyltransferase [Roseicyclus mahoneyensis]|uniref:RimJ/RimL family protein N-acetyltransferase n=1 Tax=Roseicyclus mahoneyensis TaxID=164332 RepID=A0A316GIC8_9RHOB|nr:GNAT family protein [Roseicyclus mahoneyensis]PWK60731.1 RimJ/RimL family protein N-acetyltransferase [Roseicyclus mahoneyensis]
MTRLGPPDLTLAGRHVRLLPLEQAHGAALAEHVAAGRLHELWYTFVPPPEGMAAEIDRRLGLRDRGELIPFTVLDANSQPVGMTTYMHIDHATPRVEIGSTWLAASVQRGPLNTEAKRLMLGHAFEVWGCLAVEFRTHRLNQQSRRAIERLGAQLDGILRAHLRMPNGSIRDTAVYSITATDWPTVRTHLDWQIERPR